MVARNMTVLRDVRGAEDQSLALAAVAGLAQARVLKPV